MQRCRAAGIVSLPALNGGALSGCTQHPLDTAITSGGLEQNESQLDTLVYGRDLGTPLADTEQAMGTSGHDRIIMDACTGTAVNQGEADGQPSGVSQNEPIVKEAEDGKKNICTSLSV